MTRIRQIFCALRNDKRAVTAIEYGLIAALVAVALIAGATTLGSNLTAKFSAIATEIGSTV